MERNFREEAKGTMNSDPIEIVNIFEFLASLNDRELMNSFYSDPS